MAEPAAGAPVAPDISHDAEHAFELARQARLPQVRPPAHVDAEEHEQFHAVPDAHATAAPAVPVDGAAEGQVPSWELLVDVHPSDLSAALPPPHPYGSWTSVDTERRCDGCLLPISEIVWHQCKNCMQYDLCPECTANEKTKQERARRPSDPRPVPICGQPLEQGSTDIVVNGHRLAEITYAQNQGEAQERAVLQLRANRIQEILDGDTIATVRDVWILQRALDKETDRVRARQIDMKLIAYIKDETAREPIKILSLDGGGVRGMLTIRVLQHLINKVDRLFDGCPVPYSFASIGVDKPEDVEVMTKQRQFVRHFQYIAGTSAGGLIAFCLATDVPLREVSQLFEHPDDYFKASHYRRSSWKSWAWVPESVLGLFNLKWPSDSFHWDRAKYDPEPIHTKINQIVASVFPDIADPTFGDLDQLMNPHLFDQTVALHALCSPCKSAAGELHHRRCLVLNTFEAGKGNVLIVDSSHRKWRTQSIKDVLKGTMAAPYYFPPHTNNHTYLDGGIFANDPILAALHCARLNESMTSDFSEYRLVGIGTGVGESDLVNKEDSPPHGGVSTWSMGKPKALLLNTVLEASRSLTETVSAGLASFRRLGRIKFNIDLKDPPELDDFDFVTDMDPNGPRWIAIRDSNDMQALEQFLKHKMKR